MNFAQGNMFLKWECSSLYFPLQSLVMFSFTFKYEEYKFLQAKLPSDKTTILMDFVQKRIVYLQMAWLTDLYRQILGEL